jgi:RNA polymerase-binding protein DksA
MPRAKRQEAQEVMAKRAVAGRRAGPAATKAPATRTSSTKAGRAGRAGGARGATATKGAPATKAAGSSKASKAGLAKAAPSKAAPSKKAPATAAGKSAAPTKAAPTKAAPTKAAATRSGATKAAPTKAAPAKVAPAKAAVGKAAGTKPTVLRQEARKVPAPAKGAAASKAPKEAVAEDGATAAKAAVLRQAPGAAEDGGGGKGQPTKAGSADGKAAGSSGADREGHQPNRELFLARQRELLLAERNNYTRQAEELRAQAEALALEHEPGDVQFDEEGGEGATANVDREIDLQLSAQARAAVEEIDAALAKIEAGSYGYCESCGIQIPEARLEAIPHARLCVNCKSGRLTARRQ